MTLDRSHPQERSLVALAYASDMPAETDA